MDDHPYCISGKYMVDASLIIFHRIRKVGISAQIIV